MFVDVDEAEHEGGRQEAAHTHIVAHTEVNPRNGRAEYQRYRLTQLDIAPRPTKVPGILYIL